MSAPVVITITAGTLKLADDLASLELTGEDFSCQLVSGAINAAPNLNDVPATWCAAASQTAGLTSYSLAVTWLQDWTAPGGGLSGYAYTNDAQTKAFRLMLDDVIVAEGLVIITAGAYGGEAGVPLQADAEWPCQGKPTITMPALATA